MTSASGVSIGVSFRVWLVAGCLLALPAAAQLDWKSVGVGGKSEQKGPDMQTKTSSGPAATTGDPNRDAKVTKLLDFLEKEYGLLFARQKDRVSRSLLIISMNRIPRNGATKTLLEMVKKEPDPLVRVVAWDCLISRLPMLTQDQFGQMVTATHALNDGSMLRGHLRVAALDLLSVARPDKANKELWGKIYQQTDSRLPSDDEVIDALGRCLAGWKSPEIVEYLIGRLTTLDEAFRAHRILVAAGSSVGLEAPKFDLGDQACMRDLQQQHAAWWQGAAGSWKENKGILEEARWRNLGPHLIDSPEVYAAVNPDDKKWYRDLELRPPQLKSFDVGFIVDATGSMGPALAWLRRDVRRMTAGVGVVCYEPRIGLTFYRDHGDEFVTKHQPLTGKVDLLMQALSVMEAKGGADEPEAVLEGLTESAKNNNWSSGAASRKVMVLVADAPPHAATQKQCEDLLAGHAAKGFKLYAIKLHGPYAAADQSALDALTRAGKGMALECTTDDLMNASPRKSARESVLRAYSGSGLPRPSSGRGAAASPDAAPVPAGSGGFRLGGGSGYAASGRSSYNTGGAAADGSYYPGDGPTGRRLLSAILVEAINPQYADRVEPMVAVLWELLQDPSTEKQTSFGPVQKTTVTRQPGQRGEHMNERKPVEKPKGPQDR